MPDGINVSKINVFIYSFLLTNVNAILDFCQDCCFNYVFHMLAIATLSIEGLRRIDMLPSTVDVACVGLIRNECTLKCSCFFFSLIAPSAFLRHCCTNKSH